MDDGLDCWIDDLRSRLARGAVARVWPINFGYGSGHLPGATTVRVMLADLDHLDALPLDAREWLDFPYRRAELLYDFRRLREVIG